jgi:hypothetical protein
MLCHHSPLSPSAICMPRASASVSTSTPCPQATAKTQVTLCRHQATTILHARPCATDAESAMSVPLLPCLSLPLPRTRCSRQCQNHELHQSRPPKLDATLQRLSRLARFLSTPLTCGTLVLTHLFDAEHDGHK